MDTILNVGLNDAAVNGLAEASGDERFAWDSYRRLVLMFGKTVMDVSPSAFAAVTPDNEYELDTEGLRDLVAAYKAVVIKETGREFPQHPREQLDLAIRAVFASWNTDRAMLYRRRERIADDLGTAVNVCSMVFGNLGGESGTGVAFTRDPSTGAPGHYGDYLPDAQGEDVVAGLRNTLSLDDLAVRHPAISEQLNATMRRLETHYRDLCDIEFTVERGKLWLLQTRVGKRTAGAAFRIASQLLDEGLITEDEALTRVSGRELSALLVPQFAHDAERVLLTTGTAASPGAAVGRVVFDSATATEWAAQGESVILVRRETNPDDLAGMVAAVGILTARGGKTSHAAVVARGMGRAAVCGAEALGVDEEARVLKVSTDAGTVITVNEGDTISLDGATGAVYMGALPVTDSAVSQYLRDGVEAVRAEASADDIALVECVDRVLSYADTVRRLQVRANADTGEDARRARAMGAQGIGLCRTEHMFLGERRTLIEAVILADTAGERDAALAQLLEPQRNDFVELLEAMDGLPVTVRLLDPPLHEFLPDRADLMVQVALAQAAGTPDAQAERLLTAVNRLHESNPMLGLRGVRLGLVVPGLFALQVRALAEATVARRAAGGDPLPEIMVPLVGSVRELEIVREETYGVLAQVGEEKQADLSWIPVGTMIELPRAALTAERIARAADFFSFGTNDLTQTTWGFSRDDVEAAFFAAYLEKGVFTISPFETIDARGVGRLVSMAAADGRKTRPDLKLGVCGEHGGDPESIHFFDSVGLDYVSASPFRVPVARLEAGRSTILRLHSAETSESR